MIVVAGEALIDLIAAPDGTLAAIPGGGPYNCARTVARLGGRVIFLGRISTDHFGRMLHANLVADGVDVDRVDRGAAASAAAGAAAGPSGALADAGTVEPGG